MTDAQPTTGLRVAVEADDPRVAAGLRQLLATDPGLTVTGSAQPGDADVVVVELSPVAGAASGARIVRLARSKPVIVLGFGTVAGQGLDDQPGVTYLDKSRAGDELLATVRTAALQRPTGGSSRSA